MMNENDKALVIKKGDPIISNFISNYITLLLMEDVLVKKYNFDNSEFFISESFSERLKKDFNSSIKGQLKNITMEIVSSLPLQMQKSELKKYIKNMYNNISKESEDYFQNLIEMIYLNNKERFDGFADELIEHRESLKQRNVINMQSEDELMTNQKAK